MTDQQIDEFLEMLAKSPTSARDMVRGLFAAHEAKAVPAVLFDEREAFEKWVTENGEWPQALRRESGATSYYLASTAAKWEAWQARAAIEKSAAKGPAVPQGEPVHQFRKVHCADWYDGHPDHGDGGGPYEERTLYTATPAAPSQPVTLTEEDILRCAALTLGEQHVENCGLGDIKEFARAIIAALREKRQAK